MRPGSQLTCVSRWTAAAILSHRILAVRAVVVLVSITTGRVGSILGCTGCTSGAPINILHGSANVTRRRSWASPRSRELRDSLRATPSQSDATTFEQDVILRLSLMVGDQEAEMSRKRLRSPDRQPFAHRLNRKRIWQLGSRRRDIVDHVWFSYLGRDCSDIPSADRAADWLREDLYSPDAAGQTRSTSVRCVARPMSPQLCSRAGCSLRRRSGSEVAAWDAAERELGRDSRRGIYGMTLDQLLENWLATFLILIGAKSEPL